MKRLNNSAFTLIELLLALTIVTILAVAVFSALNPAQRLKDSKDARRSADIQEILTSIHQSVVDNKGTLPTGLSAGMVEKQLGTSTGSPTCVLTSTSTPACAVAAVADCVDLMTGAQNLTKYLKTMPSDPASGTAANTKYSVKVDANGIVTVNACATDGTTTVTASR